MYTFSYIFIIQDSYIFIINILYIMKLNHQANSLYIY